MTEGNIFSLSTLVGGGGTPSQVWMEGEPISGLDRGSTPSQVCIGGVPHPRSRWRGVPHPRSGQGVPHPRSRWGVPHSADGGHPIKDQDVGGYPGIPPLSKTGWDTPLSRPGMEGIPHPRLDGVHPPFHQQNGVTPPSKTGWGTPPHHQQSEHLLRDGRCASCVHAGGLYCWR